MIYLGISEITDKVKKNIEECLKSGMIGSGNFVERFEKAVAKYVGVKHAIAVCNGSMADIVALAVLKTLHPDKTEVIVTALTFIAQTNAILINGLKPVFIDVKYNYHIDPIDVKNAITDKTLAVMPVHLLGKVNPDTDKIKKIADKNGICMLEDCCEAFGVKPKEIGTYSFYPSHTITTGEGGMIVTDNDEYAELARRIRNHGRIEGGVLNKFHFDTFGFNGKMSNLTAAIGSALVEKTDEIIRKRKDNVKEYNYLLNREWYAESPHCYPFMYDDGEKRDAMLLKLEKNGIEARKIFSCLPTQERVYQYMDFYEKGYFPIAEMIGEGGLYLPVHQGLTNKDIKKICEIIK